MTLLQRASLPYIFLCIAFTVTGQLLMKWGMLKVGKVPSESSQVPMFLLKALFHPGNFFSLVCAFLAVCSWMAALSKADISDRLLRLPFYNSYSNEEQSHVIEALASWNVA